MLDKGRPNSNHRTSSHDSAGTSPERPVRRFMPGPLDSARQIEDGVADAGSPHVVQLSIPEASIRAETMAWKERTAGRGRSSVPAVWIARTPLVLHGHAMGAITLENG